ncbi:unnamed protein product, partial [Discosporangium mesarthrocarpum]
LSKNYFLFHPKGTGVVCRDPQGIPKETFVTEYLGELHPAWRWCERTDAVEQARRRHNLKPDLPDFYNMVLERPREDKRGFGLVFIEVKWL